jgi:hypothetical protein
LFQESARLAVVGAKIAPQQIFAKFARKGSFPSNKLYYEILFNDELRSAED